METLTIELKHQKAFDLLHDLEVMDIIKVLHRNNQPYSYDKSKQKPIDEITLMAEPSLEEEWNSPEDQRWDNLL